MPNTVFHIRINGKAATLYIVYIRDHAPHSRHEYNLLAMILIQIFASEPEMGLREGLWDCEKLFA